MYSSPIVCNAGPLIALSFAGQLQVISALYNSVLVLWHEVVDSGFGCAGAAELKTAQWIEVVPSIPVDSFLEADLGRGESQVIAVACARKGSAGILVQAKKASLIPEVRPLLEWMKERGYYLSDRLIERACSEAGE